MSGSDGMKLAALLVSVGLLALVGVVKLKPVSRAGEITMMIGVGLVAVALLSAMLLVIPGAVGHWKPWLDSIGK